MPLPVNMYFYLQWLQGVDRSTVSPHQQVHVSTPAAKEKVEASKGDIEILTQRYGELRPGMTIRMELKAACELLGRTRRRTDAFRVLQKKLEDEYGVQLVIYSLRRNV